MSELDWTAYGSVFAELLREPRLNTLDAGSPDRSRLAALQALSDEQAFPPRSILNPAMAAACRAGLWLYYDFLDEAHKISQELHTPEGSYWHALVHRREPDFDNARYWLRRVGRHVIFEPLRRQAAELAAQAPPSAAFLTAQTSWDPYAFLDLCEAVLAGRSSCEMLCRQIQKREWQLLFDHCYRHASRQPQYNG